MLNWLLGRRRKGGFSTVLLIFGALGCVSALLAMALGAPLAFVNAQQVAGLPRPAPEALPELPLGTRALFVGQLPADSETGPLGLALYYVEIERTTTSQEGNTTTSWEMLGPPPEQVTLILEDGAPLTVRLPEDVDFLNAHRFDSLADTDTEGRRFVGYYPVETLTIEGTWQGDGQVLAQKLYAGSAADYVRYLRAQPGQTFMGGMLCGGLALLFLIGGAALALIGK